MPRLTFRLATMLLTFALGVASVKVAHAPAPPSKILPAPISTDTPLHPAPANTITRAEPVSTPHINLPAAKAEPESLSPYSIESFINGHPDADVKSLWRRLGIRQGVSEDRVEPNFFEHC